MPLHTEYMNESMRIFCRKQYYLECFIYVVVIGLLLLDICGFMDNVTGPLKKPSSFVIQQDKDIYSQDNNNIRSIREPSPSSCRHCVVPELKLVIRNEDACTTRTFDVMMLIVSSPGNFDERQTIRDTWGNKMLMAELSLSYIFIVGNGNNSIVDGILLKEYRKFGDILHIDFPDNYGTLAMKRIVGMRWAQRYCNQSNYFIYTDDDVFFNVFSLRRLIVAGTFSATNTVYGKCFSNGFPHRDVLSKWYTSYRVYPYSFYGPFCLGMVRIMGRQTNERVAERSRFVRYFHLEDVFTTSLVASDIINRNIEGIKMFQTRLTGCRWNCSVMAVLTSTKQHMYPLWNQITEYNCI